MADISRSMSEEHCIVCGHEFDIKNLKSEKRREVNSVFNGEKLIATLSRVFSFSENVGERKLFVCKGCYSPIQKHSYALSRLQESRMELENKGSEGLLSKKRRRSNLNTPKSAKKRDTKKTPVIFYCGYIKQSNMLVILKKVQVGKDQEKAQSEKDSHSKNQDGKKQTNQQSGTYTMKTFSKPNEQLFSQ